MNKQKLFIFALVTVFTFGLSSCRTQHVNAEPTTTYDGDRWTTRTYNLGDFYKIEMSGVSNIHFTQGAKRSVEGKGTAANLDRVKVYVQDGCLYVKNVSKENTHVNQGCDIYITAPKLTALKVSGVGSFEAKTLTAKRFDLRLSGVSNFRVDQLKSDDTHINISGVSNSDIKFKGKVADIQNSGVGSTVVDVECDEIRAKNSGQSTLKLKGHADKTNVDNSGMASIDTRGLNQY